MITERIAGYLLCYRFDRVDRNKLLFFKQSEFRSFHYVVTCLLNCINDWYLNKDKGQYTAMIFVDL